MCILFKIYFPKYKFRIDASFLYFRIADFVYLNFFHKFSFNFFFFSYSLTKKILQSLASKQLFTARMTNFVSISIPK